MQGHASVALSRPTIRRRIWLGKAREERAKVTAVRLPPAGEPHHAPVRSILKVRGDRIVEVEARP